MFKVTQNGMDRLDIEMSGRLNAEEMKIALDELVKKSKNIENGKMLYDVIDFHNTLNQKRNNFYKTFEKLDRG